MLIRVNKLFSIELSDCSPNLQRKRSILPMVMSPFMVESDKLFLQETDDDESFAGLSPIFIELKRSFKISALYSVFSGV